MKNTRKNRFQALLIALVMMIGVLPVTASAASGSSFYTFSGARFESDITDLATFELLSGNTVVSSIAEMNPNAGSAVRITAVNADNKFAPDSKGEMKVTIPGNIKISKSNAEACESRDVTCSFSSTTDQLIFKWKSSAKNEFSAIIPIELNAPATRNDVSGTWVLVVKNKSSKLMVVQPTEKVIDGANRLTTVEGTLYNNAIYRTGTDLPEWKITRYTGDWYSISYGGRYLNYGSDGSNISFSANPQYFLYTTVPTGDQFMAVGSDNSKYYLNNKSNNAGKGIQASTYDDQCVVLCRKLKSAGDEVVVIFSTNGGSASSSLGPVLVEKGSTITLPGYTGTRNGFDFIGWATKGNLKANEYVRVYQPGEAVSVDQETTFYAAWSSKNPERAQFGIRMSGDIPDEPAQHDASAYSKEHVYLDGTVIRGKWVVDTNAAGQAIEGNHVVNAVTANLTQVPNDDEIRTMYPGYDPATMYVHWYVLKYAGGMWKVDGVILSRSYKADVRYDANVATENKGLIKNIPASYKADDGTGITVGTGADGKAMKLPEYPEHIFEGWNTMADGSGQSYESGAAFTVDGSVTFYAQWTKIPTYQVSYESVEAETKEYHAGDPVKLADAADKENCLFGGWRINGVMTDASEFTMPDENVVIEPVYYGPFDVSIISDWSDNMIPYEGAMIKLTADVRAKDDTVFDYTFQWQYIGADGEWVVVPDEEGITITYELNEETSGRVWRVVVTSAVPRQD